MHLALHILKKDLRRLWPGIVVALLLSAALTYSGATRDADWLEGEALLLVTWAVLLALAVHEDPLVGDRQFWLSRPIRRPILLGSKLLFAAAVVNVPSFLSDLIILSARGFEPWHWIPHLFWKQLALTVGFILPVIAVAAILQGFAQMSLATIAILAVSIYLSGLVPMLRSEWKGIKDIRVDTFFAILGLVAALVVYLQFSRRRTWQARSLGITGVVIAEALLFGMSPIVAARERAVIWPAPGRLALHLDPRPPFRSSGPPWVGNAVQVAIPVKLSGVPSGVGTLLDLSGMEVTAPGVEYRNTTIYRGESAPTHQAIQPFYVGTDWLMLAIDPAVYNQLATHAVRMKATMVVFLYRRLQMTSIPVGSSREIAGGGRCSSRVIEGTSYTAAIGENPLLLKASCESPAGFPIPPAILFGENRRPTIGPGETINGLNEGFLSPLHRADTSFPIMPFELRTQNQMKVTPFQQAGWQVVELDLHDLKLAEYQFHRTP